MFFIVLLFFIVMIVLLFLMFLNCAVCEVVMCVSELCVLCVFRVWFPHVCLSARVCFRHVSQEKKNKTVKNMKKNKDTQDNRDNRDNHKLTHAQCTAPARVHHEPTLACAGVLVVRRRLRMCLSSQVTVRGPGLASLVPVFRAAGAEGFWLVQQFVVCDQTHRVHTASLALLRATGQDCELFLSSADGFSLVKLGISVMLWVQRLPWS